MARPAPRYYSDSDTDGGSSYGYNLTAEEEEEISALIDSISPPTPPTPSPGQNTTATPFRSSVPPRSPLKHSTTVPAPDDFLAEDELSDPSFDIRSEIDNAAHRHVAKPDPDERARFVSSLNAPSSDSKSRIAPSVRDDNPRLATFVADSKAKPAHPDPADSDVRYPDLSSALSGLQHQDELSGSPSNTPASQAEKPRKRGRPKRSVEEKNLVIEDTRSPILRFRTFPKKPFSVSDLTSGAWCELQYYYVLSKLPGGKKTRTQAMKGGTTIHEKLEREIYTPVSVEITKPEDNFGLKIWNIITGMRTLRDTGLTRELEVWGILDDGLVVNGVIDGLSYDNPDPTLEEEVLSSRSSQVTEKQPSQQQQQQHEITDFFPPEVADKREIFITDVKTRGSKKPPTKAAMRVTIIQLFLYHRFLSEMASGKLNYWRVFERYGIDPDEPFSDTFMAQMGALHEEVFSDTTSDGAGPDYVSAVSTTSEEASEAVPCDDDLESTMSSSTHAFDSLKYRTLRDLVSLLKFELQLTFPRGGASLGQIVAVEFRYRSPRPRDGGEEEGEEDPENGSVISVNTFYVEPETLDMYLQDDLQWWKGERDPRGVPVEESYKCQMCEFAGECDWRMRLEQETMRMAKKKSLARNKNKEASVSW
ncbi:hypothetical protein N0V85_000811 [Neurospora sp. IMI 360204]|nr:hypothetical protein N0V85_000811 [Neurospora sp. IMI 360204]